MLEPQTTKKFTINAAFFQEIKDDHQQLDEILVNLRRLVGHRLALPNHACEFVGMLEQLCDQLALHFSLEEAYGYFEDLVEVTPHLHVQTGRLRDQHSELFVKARDLVDQATARHKGSTDDLMKIADRFNAFDGAFTTHEMAERALIMKSLTQDEGGGD